MVDPTTQQVIVKATESYAKDFSFRTHFTLPDGKDTDFWFRVFFDEGSCGQHNVLTEPKLSTNTYFFKFGSSETPETFSVPVSTISSDCEISYDVRVTKNGDVDESRIFMKKVERGVEFSATDEIDDLGTYEVTVSALAGCQIKTVTFTVTVYDCKKDTLAIDPENSKIKALPASSYTYET